eukprot:gene2312-gene2539
MSSWIVAVYFLFPLPLLYLVIVSLPLPQSIHVPIRQFSTKVLHKILFSKIAGPLSLYTIAVLVSTLLFVESALSATRANQSYDAARHGLKEDIYRGLKWRAERNFWISSLSLVVWIILFRVSALIKENEEVR